ncbi:MAG: hypothetical protein ABI386_01870 [Rhodanobacter sp.]
MLQFIPFEDDWDALELLRPQDLVPYRAGLLTGPSTPAPDVALSARPALFSTRRHSSSESERSGARSAA